MGLEVVLNEIRARGTEEEEKILKDAERERQRILDAAEGEADALRARFVADTRTKIEAMRREQLSASEFEARRHLLTTQRELADQFRAQLLEALSNTPKAEREKLHSVLVKKALKELPKGRLHCRKEDMAFLEKATAYTRGVETTGAGGFQVESEDGSIVLDYRFETLLENSWKEILAHVKGLFEG